MSKKLSDEQVAWIIARFLLIAIYGVALYFMLAGQCGGFDVADKGWFSCRVTGSIYDWVGLIIFSFGGLFVGGIVGLITKGRVVLYSPPFTSMWSWIWFFASLAGLLLSWHL